MAALNNAVSEAVLDESAVAETLAVVPGCVCLASEARSGQ